MHARVDDTGAVWNIGQYLCYAKIPERGRNVLCWRHAIPDVIYAPFVLWLYSDVPGGEKGIAIIKGTTLLRETNNISERSNGVFILPVACACSAAAAATWTLVHLQCV